MAKVPSRQRPVYTLRLSPLERRLLEAAADAQTEYLSEYIRNRALEAARRDLATEDVGR